MMLSGWMSEMLPIDSVLDDSRLDTAAMAAKRRSNLRTANQLEVRPIGNMTIDEHQMQVGNLEEIAKKLLLFGIVPGYERPREHDVNVSILIEHWW
jgi:hypothetical protein